MAVKRDHIPLKTLLASAICEKLTIPYEHAKLMTADQVMSLISRDHYPIRRSDGLALGMSVEEVDHHSNIVIRSILDHKTKTAKVDVPAIAKGKRIRRKMADHDFQMSAKRGIVTLTFPPKPKSKIKSRGFDKTRTRRFNGTVERRS